MPEQLSVDFGAAEGTGEAQCHPPRHPRRRGRGLSPESWPFGDRAEGQQLLTPVPKLQRCSHFL